MNSKIIIGAKIIGAIITISIAAQISVDVGPIPVTGQTLAILFWAFFLSYQEAILALTMYLLIGFIGAPVFADGAHGIEKLYGGSGGYLIGFVVASGLVAHYFNKSKSKSFTTIFSLTTIGTAVILMFGVGRLMTLYGIKKGIEYGFLPFWKGAIVKILIGSFLVWGIKRLFPESKTI